MEDDLLDQTSLSLDSAFPLEPPIPDRSPFRYEDECKVLEFPVRNFWKLAKTQNDIESLTEGHCNGFYYRLLLHPRGTAGTDSESNHLSVFLEAVVQDWYPEYWVFPNVRFELTVVNFKDPKQSVTSWAHWSFSSDATSRGWQKMISHSKLTKAAGFMDDEGTILVRGKAEPPYPRLWSRAPPYRPTKLWASIRIPPYELPDKLDSILSDVSDQSQLDYSQSSLRDLSEDLSASFSEGSCVNPWHKHEEDSVIMERILSSVDPLVPSIQPTLDSDVLALFVCILYNLKEFRKRILSFPYEDIFSQSLGEKNSPGSESPSNSSGSANIISALQDTFAYMYLYPIAATCKARRLARPLGLSTEDFYMNEILRDLGIDRFESSLSSPFHFEPTLHVNCSALDCEQCNYKNTLYSQDGDKIDPQLPNIKRLLLTLHMNDLQFLENSDPFTKIHTYIFTILLKDLANVRKILKQRRLGDLMNMSKSESFSDRSNNPENDDKSLINNEDEQPLYLHDQTELESTCKSLFSGSPDSECLFRSNCDISSVYIRCKHIYSLQKALETSGHVFLKYPDVLFFYLQPNKNTKKGELFDVPLRLDATCLVPHSNHKGNTLIEHNDSSHDDDNSIKSYDTSNVSSDDKDLRSSFIDRQRSGSNRDDNMMTNSPLQYQEGEKWYSLYALVIKEGDRGGVNSYSLLLRPDEDGPWYRISEGRVERLETKMEFTEWKCHREFFCASAVYIAEDYIDLVQARDLDLSGDLKQWNPTLYYKTLERLGVSEEEILSERPFLELKNRFQYTFDNDLISDYSHPRSKNVLIRRSSQGIASPIPCKIHGYTKENLLSQYYDKLIKSCVRLDVPQLVTRRLRRLALLQPLLVTTFKRQNNAQITSSEATLLDRCLELEFITTLGEIFFSERTNQLLFNGRSKCPHLEGGQYHLTPQGRLYGFHVTMLLIQPLRELFSKMMEFAKIIQNDKDSNVAEIKLIALRDFCENVRKCYADCLKLLKDSGKKIRNTHYMIIDELRGVNNGGVDFVAKHLGISCDFLNPRYDLPVHKTNEVMAHLTSCYGLPSLFEMQCYLRHRGIYIHGLIRPHEIARMYIHFRPLLKGRNNNSSNGNNQLDLSTNTQSPRSLPSDTMNTTLSVNSNNTSLGKTLNPFKFPSLQYPSLQVVWNEELFMGRPPERIEPDSRSKYDRAVSNVVTKILVHLLPHPTMDNAIESPQGDFLNLITELDLAEILPDPDAVVSQDGSNCTCVRKSEQIVLEDPIPVPKSPFSSFRVDQKTANSVYPTLFPPPLLNIDEANSKNALNNFPFSLSQSLSDGLDPEFRRLLGERIISSPLFNDLLSIPDMQCRDLLSQVVSDVCAVQVGLLFPSDLFGCEGFYIEDKLFPSRRLTLNIELPGDRFDESKTFSDPFQRGYSMLARTEHLYWGVRKLLKLYLSEDVDQRSGEVIQGKKAKGKSNASLTCPCGNNCFANGDECQKLLKWRPTCSRDAFMLYALRCDIDPTRQGKRRFVYMHPEIEIASYIDPRKRKKMPGLVVLVAFAPLCLVQNPCIFPLTDDSDYPLLIFKWMCTKSVDLLTVGPIVCDSKCHLQHYITEWLLPIVKKLGYLEGEQLGGSEKDISRYMVLEECGVRTLQNVRRCSCAIKKINKRTGDVIIIQLKRQIDSPSSLKFKDKVALMNSIRQLEELEALELLPQSVAMERLGEIDPMQYFTLDQVTMGSVGSVRSLRSMSSVEIDGKVKRLFKKRDPSPGREVFESGSNLVSRDGRSFVDFQTLTTSEANLTIDGNSVFEEDQFMEDENKRLGGRKKGKGRRKVIIPCNKKSTFNRHVDEDVEEDEDDEEEIPMEPPINKHLEEFNQIVEYDIDYENDIMNGAISESIFEYRERGNQINILRTLVESELKEEFDGEITKFFIDRSESQGYKYASIFAWIDLQEFDKFPKNVNTFRFYLHALSHLTDVFIRFDNMENGYMVNLSDTGIIRRIFNQIMMLSESIGYEFRRHYIKMLPQLLAITTLSLEGIIMRPEIRLLAFRLGIPIARIDPMNLVDSTIDYIAINGVLDGWSLDYSHMVMIDAGRPITILARSPIEILESTSNSRRMLIGGTSYDLFIPTHIERIEKHELSFNDSESSFNDFNLLFNDSDLDPLYYRWQIRESRERRSLQKRLLRNLASLLMILQRKIMPVANIAKRFRMIFNHAGELVGISLPSGVIVGPGRDCNIRRQLVDQSSTIASGKCWKFLLLLACSEFIECTAEIRLKDLIIQFSNKFMERVQIKDVHISNPVMIMDECRSILESLEGRFCMVNNYAHHLPNVPISSAQGLPKFATLLMSRMGGGKIPDKILYPLMPPNGEIPQVVLM